VRLSSLEGELEGIGTKVGDVGGDEGMPSLCIATNVE